MCYLVQCFSCGRGAGAVVLRNHLSFLGSLQEILSRSRPPGATSWPSSLQSAIELLGQLQVGLRICSNLQVDQAWICAGRLTRSTETCFRGEIPEDLGLDPKKWTRGSTESRNQEEELWNCYNNVILSFNFKCKLKCQELFWGTHVCLKWHLIQKKKQKLDMLNC